MTNPENKKFNKIALYAFFVIAASLLFYTLLYSKAKIFDTLNGYISIIRPVIYGLCIAYLLTPVLNFFEKKLVIPLLTKKKGLTPKKKKVARGLSVLITLLLALGVLYGFFSILVPNLVSSIVNISVQFPNYVQNLLNWGTKLMEDNPQLSQLFLNFINEYYDDISKILNNNIVPHAQVLLKQLSLSLISVIKTLWNFIIGFIIAVYVLGNKELFAGQAKKIIYAFMKEDKANTFIKDTRYASETFIGFFVGKIVDSVIIGILCFIGLSILRMPYTVLISVIVGVTNIIPFFGPYIGAIPSALLILLVDPIKCLYFIIFILILQQVDGNIIGPKILGQSTGLSSFWVIFSITLFGGLWGIYGMILGVPLFAVIYYLAKRRINRRLRTKELPEDTNIYLNVEKIVDKEFFFLDENGKPQKNNSVIHHKEHHTLDELKREITEEIKKDIHADFKEDLKEDLKEDIKQDLKDDIKEDLKEDIKQDLKDDIKEDLKEDIKQDLRDDIKEDLKEDIKQDLKDDIKEDLKEDIKQDLKDDIKEDLKEDIKQDITDNIKENIIDDIKDVIKEEIKEAIVEN